MSIGSILTGKKPLISVTRATTVGEIAAMLHENRIGAVLVVEHDSIIGMVSERDIVAALHVEGVAVLEASAESVMTSPVITAPPHTHVVAALGVMTDRRVRHLPVVEGSRIMGLVSIGDLVKRRIDDVEAEASALKDYIQTS